MAITAPDSVLFQRAASPLLPDALELARLDFKYKASFIWDKINTTSGTSQRRAWFLTCTKGSATPDDVKL